MLQNKRRIAVLGDLHYESAEHADFQAAQSHVLAHKPDAVFQLGDQGGYSHCGTYLSFQEGRAFLDGFDRPAYTLTGNHDLEGPEYETDVQALSAWCEVFGQSEPYQAIDLGDALAICLSTTRFRSNWACHHEVYVDLAQMAWFEDTLARHSHKPTFVFSHAPILGSGVRVLLNLHLKCPNAWLNHTDCPERFLDVVQSHPQIRLWFSAHNHLGQHYADSVSNVGGCTFAHTGVIGAISRDGRHQSRLVEFDRSGFTLFTIDHDSAQLTANIRSDYAAGQVDILSPPPARDPVELAHFSPPALARAGHLWRHGRAVLALYRGMLVEYDADLEAPVGVVFEGLTDERILLSGCELHVINARGEARIISPNAQGRYSQVFVPSPFRERRSA